MLRKLLIYTLIMSFVLPSVAYAGASELTVMEKTAVVEKIIYGTEQTGSLVERVGKMEREIYGTESKDGLAIKLDRMYKYMKDSSVTPSFLIKLNAVEWTLNHNVTSHPAKARLESLERTVLGNVPGGSLDSRLNKLTNIAYQNGQIDAVTTTINKDTLVRIKITSPLNTKTTRVGDAVAFQVSDDVYLGGILVIANGSVGSGKVTKVEQAQNFGRDAKLEIAFENVEAIDGSIVETVLGEKAKEETKSMAKAAGASVAGMVLLGPIGIVGAAFVHGQDINVPAGTELFIQVKNDVDACGIKIK